MAAATPQELATSFAAAISARDVEAALEMWSEDAAIVAADGSLVQGRAAIAAVLEALVGNGTQVEAEVTGLYEAGGVALATGSLTLIGDGHDGSYEHRSASVVVYVRGGDGLWRIGLDAPWGLPGEGTGAAPAGPPEREA
ncbi:MAG TPA: DUF4440 domain-containing protein [Solirubrobacteraceae bacterium]|jgi:uncharacterized protein (TIGR02246 family)|nr:DUF4440 domain-containing protein [Solirubrobacteraceae bacterium]